jgi:hypothetical protein
MLCVNVAHQGPFAGERAGVCTVFPVANGVAVTFSEKENTTSEPKRSDVALKQVERWLTLVFVWKLRYEHGAFCP